MAQRIGWYGGKRIDGWETIKLPRMGENVIVLLCDGSARKDFMHKGMYGIPTWTHCGDEYVVGWRKCDTN